MSTPNYSIKVNGNENPPQLVGRLLNLNVTLFASSELDQLSLTVVGNDIAFPYLKSASIEVKLGYGQELSELGQFFQKAISLKMGAPDGGFDVDTYSINAETIAPDSPLHNPIRMILNDKENYKKRIHQVLFQHFEKYAPTWKYDPVFDPKFQTLEKEEYLYLENGQESIIEFLARQAKEEGGIVKYLGFNIIFVDPENHFSLDEQVISIEKHEIIGLHLTFDPKWNVGKVIVPYWNDRLGAKRVWSKTNSENEREYVMPTYYSSKEEAQKACLQKVAELSKKSDQMQVQLIGNQNIRPFKKIKINWDNEYIGGLWDVEKVIHSLSEKGFITDVTLSRFVEERTTTLTP